MNGDIDQILKRKILDSPYWKTDCFALNAAGLCEKAADLREVGGLAHQNQRPTAYICLVYKLLLIDPPREIVEEMLRQPYFKYLTAMAALFVRLRYEPLAVHRLLEPLLGDYRKLRLQQRELTLWHIDELIDALLTEERVFGLALPRMPARLKLEDVGLEPREPLVEC